MRGAFLLAGCVLAACGASPQPGTTSTRLLPPTVLPVLAPAPKPAPADPVVPLDPAIKRGTLPNGLTYYVMKHQKPEQRAALWLAVDAGSVLEDDDQRGLAHFVEHMAFNGTRRFPKQAIVDYIEKAGIRFGADLNAYTSFDQTVYQLTVPTDRTEVVMKGLDILRDWAGDISFDPVEVDKERGVVLEEWRQGRGAFARINDQQWPVRLQGSRYAQRLPIGLPEVIKGAPRDKLVRFYKDWYRPHNLAVIAVGDFDPAMIEKEIAARFGDLVEPAQTRARTPVPVPHDHELAVTIATDREMPVTRVTISDKIDHRGTSTRGDYRRHLAESLYHAMLSARFSELAQEPDAPFTGAGSSTTTLTRTCDAFVRGAVPRGGKVAETLTALFREIARVERHGFLPVELERATRDVLARDETLAREADKASATDLADEITRNFFTGEEMGGRAWELAADRELLPGITLDELNHLARGWGGAKGRVIALAGPAGAKLPSEAELRAVVASAASVPVEPWKDSGGARASGPQALLDHPPVAGKVVTTTHDAAADATVWVLSNGVRVIAKPTTFQNDEIELLGWQLGGTSLVPDKDFVHARFASQIVNASGAGGLDAVALRKALAGKVVRMFGGLGELGEQVFGSARPADLETALQLLHLRLTAPRRDERAFATWKASQRELLQHRTSQPEVMFFDEMTAVTSGNHLRRRPDTEAMLDEVSLDRALAIYHERMADLGGFTFVFVGNLDLATLQPLVETYLGSLPSKGKKAHWKDIGIRYPVGRVTRQITAGTEPKSLVQLSMSGPAPWTLDGARDARILSMVLQIRLREVLREDLGGVYSARVSAFLTREPVQRRNLQISFGCDPANVDKLEAAALAEVRAIAKAGIGADYLAKVAEQLRRQHETDLKTNRWWVGSLREAYYFHDDFARYTDIDAVLVRVTAANLKATASRFLDEKNLVTGVLRPAAATAPAPAAPAPSVPAPAPAK